MANKPVTRYEKNGLQVTTVSSEFHTSMIGVLAGHLHDPDDFPGAAHFAEHMKSHGAEAAYLDLMKGRKPTPVSSTELLRVMRRYLGGTDGEGMNVFTVHTYTSYGHADLLSRLQLKRVFAAFAGTVRDGIYDTHSNDADGMLGGDIMSIERNAVYNESGLGEEVPTFAMSERVTKILYGGHVLARGIGDTPREQLESLTLEKLKAWARQYYVPGNMCVVFSGPKIHEAIEMVRKAGLDQLPAWPLTGPQPDITVPELRDVRRSDIAWPTTGMTHLMQAWPTQPSVSKDKMALMVLASVLKELIEEELRERVYPFPGGVYHPSFEWDSSPVHGTLISWFATRGGTAHAQELSERAMAVIREVKERRTTRVQEAVEDLRDNFIFDHQNVLEYDGGSLVESMMDAIAEGDRELEQFTLFPKRMARVSARDVRRVARKYLHEDRFVQVMLGPDF